MKFIKSFFFPSGKYNKNYTNFIKWSFISNILSSTQYVISTHNMLTAINTDTENIRTFNYISKDIIGQIGSICYMSNLGKKIDKEPYKFLNYTNIMQQISQLTMSITYLVPSYFLLFGGLSNLLNNISYIGFGSINTKCINKLSESNNLGEIYAKVTIFNTLGSSFGLLSGLTIITIIPDRHVQICLLPFIGFLKIYTYNKAIKHLIL